MSRERHSRESDSDRNDNNDGTNVFVVGLQPVTKEKDLKEICDKYGQVVSCDLMMDPHTGAFGCRSDERSKRCPGVLALYGCPTRMKLLL